MVLPLLALVPLLPAAGHAIAGFAISHGMLHGAVGLTAQAAQHFGGQMAVNVVQGAIANPGVASALGAASGLGTAAGIASQQGSWVVDGVEKGFDAFSRFLEEL